MITSTTYQRDQFPFQRRHFLWCGFVFCISQSKLSNTVTSPWIKKSIKIFCYYFVFVLIQFIMREDVKRRRPQEGVFLCYYVFPEWVFIQYFLRGSQQLIGWWSGMMRWMDCILQLFGGVPMKEVMPPLSNTLFSFSPLPFFYFFWLKNLT